MDGWKKARKDEQGMDRRRKKERENSRNNHQVPQQLEASISGSLSFPYPFSQGKEVQHEPQVNKQ